MSDCLFCKIARKEVESDSVYEDDAVIAFRDINPAARIHILVIPKKHIEGITEARSGDSELLGRILLAAKEIARQERIGETGFRVLVNSGPAAGQMVKHLHFHLLGGEKLKAI